MQLFVTLASPTVTSGSYSIYGSYTFVTFTTNGSFSVPSNCNMYTLVVGSGGGTSWGGNGNYGTSGGGGGGVGYGLLPFTSGNTYTVTIGNTIHKKRIFGF